MKREQATIIACATVLAVGLAAALPSAGIFGADHAAKAGSSHLASYGMAVVEHRSADGELLATQTMHNQLYDAGEDLLLQQIFADGATAVADNVQIGAICLTADDTALSETDTNTNFNTRHTADDTGQAANPIVSTNNCKTDDAVTFAGQIATIGPLTFEAGTDATDNWYAAGTVAQIGICAAHSADDDVRGCAAPLFAAVDVADVTLNDDETLSVTYTFDMSSTGT